MQEFQCSFSLLFCSFHFSRYGYFSFREQKEIQVFEAAKEGRVNRYYPISVILTLVLSGVSFRASYNFCKH